MTDAEDMPIAGATVVSAPDDSCVGIDPANIGSDGCRAFATKTASDGRFEIEVHPTVVASFLSVEGDGFAAASVADVRVGDDVRVRLQRARWITGRVAALDGTPIRGARVRIAGLIDVFRIERATTTDVNGAYNLSGLPPLLGADAAAFAETRLYGMADADGFARAFIELNPLGAPAHAAWKTGHLDFTLLRGAVLHGHVFDAATGDPLPGARVLLWRDEGTRTFASKSGASIVNPWARAVVAETTTDDSGAFSLSRLPSRGGSDVFPNGIVGFVSAWRADHSVSTEPIPAPDDGATVERDLRVWPAATVEGRVVDRAGRPLAGIWTWTVVEGREGRSEVPPQIEAPITTATTDASGYYRIAGVRAGDGSRFLVRVRATRSFAARPGPSAEVQASVQAGTTTRAPDIVLDDTTVPAVRVRVTDTQGRLVGGARIARAGEARTTVRTGLDGIALFREPLTAEQKEPPGDTIRLVVRARGYAPATADVVPTRPEPATIDVVLQSGFRISGRVEYRDGQPAAGVMITVADGRLPAADVFTGWPSVDQAKPGVPPLALTAIVRTDSDGTFVARNLPDGPYHVEARTSGQDSLDTVTPRARTAIVSGVAAGATGLRLVLPVGGGPRTFALDGIVADTATQATVADVYGVAVRESLTVVGVPTSTGLRFEGLTQGTWTIRVAAPGYRCSEVRDVQIDEGDSLQPLRIEIDRGVTVRGRVEALEPPLPDVFSLRVVPIITAARGMFTESPPQSVLIGKDHSFQATGFGPGRYRVVVSVSATDTRGAWTLVARAGGTVAVSESSGTVAADVVLTRAGFLLFDVKDSRLASLHGPSSDAGRRQFSATSLIEVIDVRGVVVAGQKGIWGDVQESIPLAPGEYIIRLTLSGESPREERVAIRSGNVATISFKMR